METVMEIKYEIGLEIDKRQTDNKRDEIVFEF